MEDYRIDPQTGAVIFKRSKQKERVKELERTVRDLNERVEHLEQIISSLLDN